MRKVKRFWSIVLTISLISVMPAALVSAITTSESLARMKSMLNEGAFQVYYTAPAADRTYFGAKFEPVSGVYTGTPANTKFSQITNAISSSYDDSFTESQTNANVSRQSYTQQPKTGVLMEYNWNCSNLSINPADYENYIKNTIDNIAASGDDVLLVFGKEMNIDNNFPNPKDFIALYKYAAEYAHTKDNIAMVWAPNDVSSLDVTFEDFYPGDAYVDWVGISLYVIPYFLGEKDHGRLTESNNIGFVTGEYANASMRAKSIIDFMQRNNIKKPVMITEGSVGYRHTKTGEDFTAWAAPQIRRLYGELPRIFPQIKINICFNNTVIYDWYRYDISSSPELSELYQQLMQDPIYLHEYPSRSNIEYVPLKDMSVTDTLMLSAYAYEPKASDITVKYMLDGKELYSTSNAPYTFTLSKDMITSGAHVLSADMYVGNKKIRGTQVKLNSVNETAAPQQISVLCNGSPIIFDQPPIIQNDRTLVPLRVIFEALDAKVDWDDSTRSVIAKREDISIKLQIGSTQLYVNDKAVTLEVSAQIIGDRTMVPVRAIAESFGADVQWVSESKTIIITT